MFPSQSTPSKRPKRRVESHRILSVIILHALILQTIPFELRRKPSTANWWVLLLALPEGTSIYNNQYRPLFEVCPRDHGNVVGTLQGTDEASSYAIKNIFLEFDMFSNSELTRQIRQQNSGKMVFLYDSILWHRKITKNKSDILWNINLNVPAQSMKAILMLFEDPDRTHTYQY